MTPLTRWNEQWNTGNQAIDAEHCRLYGMIMVLNQAWELGYGASVLGGMLDELIDYTNTHFANEEALLESLGNPHLPEHRLIHQELRERVLAFKQRFEAKIDHRDAIGVEVGVFLQDWLIHHILEVDFRALHH